MALEGALRDCGLAEVLQLLAGGRRTGTLRVAGGAGSRVALLRFADGQVTGGRWEDDPDALLGALLACGLAAAADVARAADWALAQQPPGHVVDGLVEIGAVTRQARDAVIARLVDDLCFELVTVHEGTWAFADADDAVPGREPASGVRVGGEALLLDAARRRDEWPAIEAAVGSLASVPRLVDCDDTAPVSEPAEAWQCLAAIDGVRTLRQVAAAAGVRALDAARRVARWIELGVVSCDATAHLSPGTGVGPALAIAQRDLGYAALRRGDHAGAAAAWSRYLAVAPNAPDAGRVRAARDAVAHLEELLSSHVRA